MPHPVNQWRLRKVDSWRDAVGRLLIPSRCLVCAEPGLAAADLCRACARVLPRRGRLCPGCLGPLPGAAPHFPACRAGAPAFGAAHAAFDYAFPLDRLLPAFKFHGDLAAGGLLADLLARSLVGAPRPQALVPVPLHWRRLRARGYDQALELARTVARRLDVPVRADRLRRTRATEAQTTRDALARRANVAGAFACARGAVLPAHVALVDDVLTTGATLRACAAALHAAGVARVDAWVVARAPAPGERA